MKPIPRVQAWVLSVVLGLLFLLIGWSKFAMSSAQHWQERFAHWGYPRGSQYLVGIIEMAAGVGLLIPRSRRVAAAMLMIVMIGAAFTHLIHAEFQRVIPSALLGAAAFLLYAGTIRRGDRNGEVRSNGEPSS